MTYYLTTTAKVKNGRRHIFEKSTDVKHLEKIAKNINKDRYVVEIYAGNWEHLETIH